MQFLILFSILPLISKAQLTEPDEIWDSIKSAIAPEIAGGFTDIYETPFTQPLADYGWEDGVHISPDGLNLYALYAPADLLSWINYISVNIGLPVCSTFGNMSFLRHYANDYGMDLATNIFGCDSALNIDILYAHRNTIDDAFANWTLSDIARPGFIEGGPFPLFSETDPDIVDHFLFTGNSDIWMINNTTANPAGINEAIRLPEPINPATNEFNADNPILKRINHSDTLLLIYEKYFIGEYRDFMYAFSFDDGNTWEAPVKINTINNDAGHIEHPQLYSDDSGTWLYYSVDYDIWRSKQSIANNWDAWTDPEPVILKGNAIAIGEPSITAQGDISFLVAFENPASTNPFDKLDCDPWYVKHKVAGSEISQTISRHEFTIYPNPSGGAFKIQSKSILPVQCLKIMNAGGVQIYGDLHFTFEKEIKIPSPKPGIYFVQLFFADGNQSIQKLILY